MKRILRPNHVSQGAVSGTFHPSANESQAVNEVLRGVAEGCHARPGAAISAAFSGIAGEHLRGGQQLAGLKAGAPGDKFLAERFNRCSQIRHALRADVAGAEILVFPPVRQNQTDEPRHDRDVLAGQGLQHEISELRGFSPARVDANNLLALRLRAFEPPDWISGHHR
jgi:hypothetical protein